MQAAALSTNDLKWAANLDMIMGFIREHGYRPSKYKADERNMINWVKSQKRRYEAGIMPEYRREPFRQLLELMVALRRRNQYTYESVDAAIDALGMPSMVM